MNEHCYGCYYEKYCDIPYERKGERLERIPLFCPYKEDLRNEGRDYYDEC